VVSVLASFIGVGMNSVLGSLLALILGPPLGSVFVWYLALLGIGFTVGSVFISVYGGLSGGSVQVKNYSEPR
jgi:hypothetical protein